MLLSGSKSRLPVSGGFKNRAIPSFAAPSPIREDVGVGGSIHDFMIQLGLAEKKQIKFFVNAEDSRSVRAASSPLKTIAKAGKTSCLPCSSTD